MLMQIKNFIIKHFWLLALYAFAFLVLAISLRINLFRYNNFDFGKFDLGNMTQMVWNTAYNGKFLWLTDYFGTNLPRWAMSHVDPILLLFVPLFWVFPHPLTLVFSQLILVIFSSIIVFKIAELELGSKFVAFIFGAAFLLYPAIGFLLAWTGFHGVTAVIPFFLGAFYVFEKMYKSQNFTKKGLVAFWLLLILSMMGKEQVPLHVIMFGLFILFFRNKRKLALSMIGVGLVWFVTAFFIIIPQYAHYRIEGYERFEKELGITGGSDINDVSNPNYFLSRYEGFGDTYSEVIINMIIKPGLVIKVFFDGDNLKNFQQTLVPMAFSPFLYPQLFILALPDFLINYLTTEGGIGTGEITNHRVSMIIPGLFLAAIFAVSHFSKEFEYHLQKRKLYFSFNRLTRTHYAIFFSGIILAANIYTTFSYGNPIYLWLTQAVAKRINGVVLAKQVDAEISLDDLEIGDRVRLTPLDNKDRECALKVVNFIPKDASVSGPDYLGAHLSMRETYSIFPSLYTSADYVIVDIFSQKVVRILDLDSSIINRVVGDMIKNPNYKLAMGCGNMFVFKNVGPHGKQTLLPLQERFTYQETMDLEIFESLTIVDYQMPASIKRSESKTANIVYVKRSEERLSDYFLFTSFVHEDTGEVYQIANLPAFGLLALKDWSEDTYYIEDLELVMPDHVPTGNYKIFIGMYNQIRTRSIYLGDILVE